MKFWTYRFPVTVDGCAYELRLEAGLTDACLKLQHHGRWLEDRQSFKQGGYRLHRLSLPTPQGELVFELGPRSAWTYGVQVSRGHEVLYRSHPDPFAHLARVQSQLSAAPAPGKEDIGRLKAHAPAIATDVALGLLFFVLGKLTDLRTAALVTAGVGLALLPVQWAINRWSPRRLDLLGGMALFGIVMMLLSAGFSWYFDSDSAVQLKATVIGAIGAACFGVDALLARGRWLGERMKTYLVYDDVDARRLAAGMGAAGACMAGLNLAVAQLMSKDAWLWYTLWGDLLLMMVLAQLAIQWSRQRPPALPAAR